VVVVVEVDVVVEVEVDVLVLDDVVVVDDAGGLVDPATHGTQAAASTSTGPSRINRAPRRSLHPAAP
jgi:hypothetical protein